MSLNPKITDLGSKVRLDWTADLTGQGYRFYVDGVAVSRTFKPDTNSTTFSKPDSGTHRYGVQKMDVVDQLEEVSFPAPPPPPPPPPPSSEVFYGAHQDLIYFGSEWHQTRIDLMAALGATASRSLLLWRNVEKSHGSYDWSRPDSVLAKTKAAGMVNVFSIAAWPTWTGATDDWNVPSNYSQALAYYVDFCAKCAARYPGQRWEIWNEPNEKYFWVPQPPNADQYVQMFKAAQAAILAADPTAKVGVGGITGLVNGCCVTGKNFLTQMVQAGCTFDYCGVHPYDGGPPLSDNTFDSNFTDTQVIHDHLVSLGLPDVKLWLTEWGWNSNSVGLQTQADYVKQSLETIRDKYAPFVEVATYFLDIDTAGYPGFGLHTRQDPGGVQKPSAVAFKNFMATV